MGSRHLFHLKNGVNNLTKTPSFNNIWIDTSPSALDLVLSKLHLQSVHDPSQFFAKDPPRFQGSLSFFQNLFAQSIPNQSIPNQTIAKKAIIEMVRLDANTPSMVMLQHILGLQESSNSPLKLKPKDHARFEDVKAAEPVFVSVDLEAWERDQSKITEIGLSFLDTRSILGTDPGDNSSNWLSKIESMHLRIDEYKQLTNRWFLRGCPSKFDFGKSLFVPLNEIHKSLSILFRYPSPADRKFFVERRQLDEIGPDDSNSGRKIILVGHGLSNDTAYLKRLDFHPNAAGDVISQFDTSNLAGTSKKETVGLARMLKGLGVDARNLHNAGNDAAYTLQALVMMAVKHTREPNAYLKAIAEAQVSKRPKKKDKKAIKEATNDGPEVTKAGAIREAIADEASTTTMPAADLLEPAISSEASKDKEPFITRTSEPPSSPKMVKKRPHLTEPDSFVEYLKTRSKDRQQNNAIRADHSFFSSLLPVSGPEEDELEERPPDVETSDKPSASIDALLSIPRKEETAAATKTISQTSPSKPSKESHEGDEMASELWDDEFQAELRASKTERWDNPGFEPLTMGRRKSMEGGQGEEPANRYMKRRHASEEPKSENVGEGPSNKKNRTYTNKEARQHEKQRGREVKLATKKAAERTAENDKWFDITPW